MSLNWDTTKIANGDALCWLPATTGQKDEERPMNPITNGLIWSMMAIDMGTITAKNYLEVFARCQLVSKLSGAPLQKLVDGKREDIDFTLEDIKAHIGLSTNVSTRTMAQFSQRWGRQFVEEEMCRAAREEKGK